MLDARSPLEAEIRRLIAAAGPMPFGDYMRLCLTHPQYGYYITRDPFGSRGDFVTSPEISQIFGELIGLWMAAVWKQMGAPENVRVVELGPGRGTMMNDALRAARTVKSFYEAIVVHLVEVSPTLQQAQQKRLADLGVPILWHASFDEIPAGPVIVVANEFVDALPVHQAIKAADGWHERVVVVGPGDTLSYGLARDPLPFFDGTLPRALRQAPDGSIFEWRTDQFALALGRRVRADGAALIIDYGHMRCALGDTVQAVSGHSFADPLRKPGEADLTAHVDFETLALGAECIGTRCHGPVTQREFLLALGIRERAAVLKSKAPREKASEIDGAVSRLIRTDNRGMGELFKVLGLADPKIGPLPGFAAPAAAAKP
jgi:SAM-dependent MidA family methyltransferase